MNQQAAQTSAFKEMVTLADNLRTECIWIAEPVATFKSYENREFALSFFYLCTIILPWMDRVKNKKNPDISILPLCDIPTLRHFWKRQYWHLLRDFLWMRQWRSQWSYTSFSLIVRLKKPCEVKKGQSMQIQWTCFVNF